MILNVELLSFHPVFGVYVRIPEYPLLMGDIEEFGNEEPSPFFCCHVGAFFFKVFFCMFDEERANSTFEKTIPSQSIL